MKRLRLPIWLLMCGVVGCAAPPSAAGGESPIKVSANRRWQNTGIRVEAGQPFTLTDVAGSIRDQDTKVTGGEGWDYICGEAGCCEPLPGVRRAALIGRVGKETFLVGKGGEFTTKSSGLLELRVNDCDEGLHDNAGTLSLRSVDHR